MKKIIEHLKKYRATPKPVGVLIALFAAFLIFWAGTAVGYRKAMFSYRWHSNYAEQFAGDRSPLALPMDGDGDIMPNPHGAFGVIVSESLPTLIIKGPHEAEKTIVVTPETTIKNIHDDAASSSLAVGQGVVTIGAPDEQGRIVASFIRILPPLLKDSPRVPAANGATSTASLK